MNPHERAAALALASKPDLTACEVARMQSFLAADVARIDQLERELSDARNHEYARELLLLEKICKKQRVALWKCVEISGADPSDGVPDEPGLHEYAPYCVQELRDDFNENIATDGEWISENIRLREVAAFLAESIENPTMQTQTEALAAWKELN